MKIRWKQSRAITALLLCLLTLSMGGCSFWQAAMSELGQTIYSEPADSSVSSGEVSSGKPKRVQSVGSGASRRGADLKDLDAVGELVEEDEKPGAPSLPGGQQLLKTKHVWPLSMMPYRAMLSEQEQRVYDDIYRNVTARNAQFSLAEGINVEQINRVMSAVYYDNPDFFWLDSSYRYSYNLQNIVTGVRISFNDTVERFAESKKAFDLAADGIIKEAAQLSGDVVKEKYVHDRLLDMVEYDLQAPRNQSAYSALVDGRSVCAGYTRAFQYILMQLDIRSYYCVGVAKEEHAWNLVELDGVFYNTDLAWDDPIGNPPGSYSYDYFNLTDEQLAYDHRRTGMSLDLPACNDGENGYVEVFDPEEGGRAVKKGGAPARYQELGFSGREVLYTLEDYYEASRQSLVEAGMGETVRRFVLADETLRIQVYDAVKSDEWFNQFVIPAARELGVDGFSAGIDVSVETLEDGYILLIQTISLTRSK